MCVADTKVEGVVLPPGSKLSGKEYDADVLAQDDAWIEKLDHEAFKEDVRELGKQLAAQQGPEDVVRTAPGFVRAHSAACPRVMLRDRAAISPAALCTWGLSLSRALALVVARRLTSTRSFGGRAHAASSAC